MAALSAFGEFMQFTGLLGKQLKDDSVMELLEHFDIDVVYDFDRTHEGMEDVYWAASQENGFQFRFDETQKLDVAFLYMVAREGFTPIPHSEIDVPIYESFAVAKSAFEKEGLEFVNSPGEDQDDKWYQRWIKANRGSFTTHYEFKDNKLRMITLSLVK
ncbi:MAG: hypothetical protein KUG79_15645 [Pseudomonadales bacterium]|nr:hypothetical protein [Pseudomonadales bacterium]